jgi:hypothetical protein
MRQADGLYIRMQAQPHLPSGVLDAEDTITAARAEAQQAMPETAREVHEAAGHRKGMGEHAASAVHVR